MPPFGSPGQVTWPINTPGIRLLELKGLEGDDAFTIAGNHPFNFGGAPGIFVEGGDPDNGSDVLNFNGSGAAIVADLALRTVSEANPVSFSGIETVNIDSATADLRVNTSAANTIAVNVPGNTISDGVLETVNFTAGTKALQVFGEEGNDTFTVTSGAIPVFIDGGDPIGVLPGDLLTVLGAVGFFTGPENDEGGFLTGGANVSFDHIESLAAVGLAACPFLILGTGGDDDITVIARDALTHVGANGVQDLRQ